MNSEQRRAARRKRREEKRARAKAERVKACTLETVADLNSLCKASKQAARGVMWKASTQRYMKDYLRNAVKSRQDLLEGRDIAGVSSASTCGSAASCGTSAPCTSPSA